MFFSVVQMFFLYYRYVALLHTKQKYVFVVSVWFVALFFLSGSFMEALGCEEGPAEGLSNASGFAFGNCIWPCTRAKSNVESESGPAEGPDAI